MLASRIAALTIATGTLVAAAGPAFANDSDHTSPRDDRHASVVIDPNPVRSHGRLMVSDGYDHHLACKPGVKFAIAWSDGFKDGKIKLTRDEHGGRQDGGYGDDAAGGMGGGYGDDAAGGQDGKSGMDGMHDKDGMHGKDGKDGMDRHEPLVGYGRATWRPGWYDVKLTCDGDRHPSAYGKLHVVPRGAHTGDGGSILASGASSTQKTSGVALLGSAAGVGAFGLRRKLKAGR